MTTSSEAARLVVAAARMGEADIMGWWRSHGLDAVGDYLLPDLFPRTALVAGAELAVLSAAKRHSDALPDRDDVVHLFGEPLPAFAEALAWLAELKTGSNSRFLSQLHAWTTIGEAKAGVSAMSGEAPPGERIGATLRLGKVQTAELAEPVRVTAIAKALAATYADQGQDLAVPYFDLT